MGQTFAEKRLAHESRERLIISDVVLGWSSKHFFFYTHPARKREYIRGEEDLISRL